MSIGGAAVAGSRALKSTAISSEWMTHGVVSAELSPGQSQSGGGPFHSPLHSGGGQGQSGLGVDGSVDLCMAVALTLENPVLAP